MRTRKLIFGMVILLLLARLLSTEIPSTSKAQPGKGQVEAPAKEKVENPAPHFKLTFTEQGVGRTREEAVQMALRKATEKVLAYLRNMNPSFEWKPSEDYVFRHLLKEEEPQRLLPDFIMKTGGTEESWQKWTLTVEVSDTDFEDMFRLNQQFTLGHRQTDRLVFVAKLTVFFLAAALLCLGYLRLVENTRGYFSRWFLAGVVGLLVVVGITLFLII